MKPIVIAGGNLLTRLQCRLSRSARANQNGQEFGRPQTRGPARQQPLAWPVLLGRLNGGSTSSVQEWGGHFYTLLRIERTARTVQYRNFKLHDGITLVARNDEGHEVRYTGIRSIAERRGRFKIYSMSD